MSSTDCLLLQANGTTNSKDDGTHLHANDEGNACSEKCTKQMSSVHSEWGATMPNIPSKRVSRFSPAAKLDDDSPSAVDLDRSSAVVAVVEVMVP